MCSDRTTKIKSDAFFPSPIEDGGAAEETHWNEMAADLIVRYSG